MKTYFAFFKMSFLTRIQYRTAAIAGAATQLVFGIMLVLVMQAFFASSDAPQPMSLSQAITYIWLGQAFLAALPSSLDREITDSVHTGKVAYELTRPIDLYTMWFMRTLAHRTAPALLRSVPQFIITIFLLPKDMRMTLPEMPAFASWIAAFIFAVILSTAITNFLQAIVLYTVQADGIMRFLPTLVTFMSGLIVPLKFFPEWAQTFMRYQPFAGIQDLPNQVFCGSLPPESILWIIPLQILWIIVFAIIGRALMHTSIKRISVAGG